MEGDTGYCVNPKNPFFDIILGKTEVAPNFKMIFPERVADKLPKSTVPIRFDVVNGGSFTATYYGSQKKPMVDKQGWEGFLNGNKLVAGDILVLEVLKNTDEKLVIKVIIMRLAEATSMLPGKTFATAIDLE